MRCNRTGLGIRRMALVVCELWGWGWQLQAALDRELDLVSWVGVSLLRDFGAL